MDLANSLATVLLFDLDPKRPWRNTNGDLVVSVGDSCLSKLRATDSMDFDKESPRCDPSFTAYDDKYRGRDLAIYLDNIMKDQWKNRDEM